MRPLSSVLFVAPNNETLDKWVHSLSRGWAYCILKAGSVEYGFEVLRSKKSLDGVVLGLDLPDFGVRTLQRMIQDCHQAPVGVVALTTGRLNGAYDSALHYGAHACVQKDLFEPSNFHR